MNDNFNDRLLDASLKEYSRVSPPDDFASRVLAKPGARRPAWRWLWIPAVAAAALACGVLMMHPAPKIAPAPAVAFHPSTTAVERTVHPYVVARHVAMKKEPPPFHTLTAVEMASLTLPAELLAKQEEKPITDIVIPELTVAPLEIPTLPEAEGEKP
jgi:hypothetical protein